MVRQSYPSSLARSSRWVRTNVNSTLQAEVVDYFVGHVPGGGVDHQDFFENVEFVADTDPAERAHVVDVEVQADPEGEFGDVFRFFADVFFAEVDGDKAG